MKVNSGQDFLYLLCDDHTLKSVRIIEDQEIMDNSNIHAVLFEPEILCRTFDVSPIGVLWCVKLDGSLFYFDDFERQWVDASVGSHIKSELAKAKNFQVTLNTMEWINTESSRRKRMARLNGKFVSL